MTAPDPLRGQTQLDELTVPHWVSRLAGGAAVRPVWRNEDGGLTYRFGDGEAFLKAQKPGPDWDPDAERVRLEWVAGFVPAPIVLSQGVHGGLHWLLTAGLSGRSAVDAAWRARPEVAVPALGRGLRRFHDSVPVAACPFSWSVEHRVAHYDRHRVFLDRTPPLDRVVCHGDACNPNFLLDDDGVVSGYVDLGGLGVADRWADLAPALMSLTWNYGHGYEAAFLAAYGVADDPAKRVYYSALWDGAGDSLGRDGLVPLPPPGGGDSGGTQ